MAAIGIITIVTIALGNQPTALDRSLKGLSPKFDGEKRADLIALSAIKLPFSSIMLERINTIRKNQ
jgi:hypothetical protein